MVHDDTPPQAERREFVKLLALVGMSSALGGVPLAFAQAVPAKPESPPPAKPEPPAAQDAPEISEDARALAAIVERRYGRHLKPAQLEAVTREIDRRLRLGRTLRDLKLANGDEPDFVFGA